MTRSLPLIAPYRAGATLAQLDFRSTNFTAANLGAVTSDSNDLRLATLAPARLNGSIFPNNDLETTDLNGATGKVAQASGNTWRSRSPRTRWAKVEVHRTRPRPNG